MTSKEGPGTKNKRCVIYLGIARLGGEGGGVKMLARIICEHFAQTKNSEWHYEDKKVPLQIQRRLLKKTDIHLAN